MMMTILSLRKQWIMSCLMLVVLVLTGCRNYSLSINDKVVYLPPALLKDFVMSDEHLRTCVEQTIIDRHITETPQLTFLNCSHAGIQDLSGLEKFYNLQQINLSENEITSVTPLKQLAQVHVLLLNKNKIKDVSPLLALVNLTELDVSENTEMTCGDLQQLTHNFSQGSLKVSLPEQCRFQ